MKGTGPAMSQTQHPFGDPAATHYHQRADLMRELQRRETNLRMEPVVLGRDPLAPISGEIAVPARHGWTVLAAILLVIALAACVGVALLP